MVFAGFLDFEEVVLIEEDVALLEEPEEVCGEVGRRGGCAFGEDGFPEAFEFGGFVGADPLDHDGGAGGEDGSDGEGVGAGRAGVEFALAFEDGEVLHFDGAADGRDHDGRVFARVISALAEAGEEGWGEVFGRDGCGDLDFAGFLEGEWVAVLDGEAFRFAAVIDPGFRVVGFDAPAGFLFHGFEPCVDGFLAAFGADAGVVDLEGDVREAFAVEAAEGGLIGVEVGWSEPFAGHAAFGDRLVVSAGRVDLDGFLFDVFGAPVGGPEVAHGFIAGEEE